MFVCVCVCVCVCVSMCKRSPAPAEREMAVQKSAAPRPRRADDGRSKIRPPITLFLIFLRGYRYYLGPFRKVAKTFFSIKHINWSFYTNFLDINA